MTVEEKRIVMAVFGTLLEEHTFNELNSSPFNFGSLTIEEMEGVYKRLKYENYCSDHGIRYEDMTEADYEEYEMEKAREMGYDI